MPTGIFERTKEHGEKISKALTGRIISETHKSNCQCFCCRNKRGEFKHSKKTKRKISEANIGSNHPNWKGGIKKDSKGYIYIWEPNHPRANSNKGYVGRSCLIAEEMLGRYLFPNEIAHHKNEIKDDDRPENIEVKKSRSIHTKYHRNIQELDKREKKKR